MLHRPLIFYAAVFLVCYAPRKSRHQIHGTGTNFWWIASFSIDIIVCFLGRGTKGRLHCTPRQRSVPQKSWLVFAARSLDGIFGFSLRHRLAFSSARQTSTFLKFAGGHCTAEVHRQRKGLKRDGITAAAGRPSGRARHWHWRRLRRLFLVVVDLLALRGIVCLCGHLRSLVPRCGIRSRGILRV
jgi:hypothetical protein